MHYLNQRKPGKHIAEVAADMVAKQVTITGQKGWQNIWRGSDDIFGTTRSNERLAEMYSKVDLVYACVRELSTSLASIPLIVGVDRGDGFEKAEGTQADEALGLFYDNEWYTYSQMIELLVGRLSLSGASFTMQELYKNRTGVARLTPLPTHISQPITKGPQILHYDVQAGDDIIHVPPEEMMAHMYLNPSCYQGYLSPLQAASKRLTIDIEQANTSAEMMVNQSLPGMVGRLKGQLKQDQIQQIRDSLYSESGGGNEHRGRAVFFPSQVEDIQFNTVKDIDQKVLSSLTESRLCMVYGIPPIIIGAVVGLDRSTFSNYGEARKSFYSETLVPLANFSSATFTRSIFRMHGEMELEYRFDMSKVKELQPDMGAVIEQTAKLYEVGVIDRNEARERAGFDIEEEVEVADDGAVMTTGAENVTQETVLNGAQITAATQIVTAVAESILPRDAGIGQLIVMFNLTSEQAEQMMGSVGKGFEAAKPEPKPNPFQPPTPSEETSEETSEEPSEDEEVGKTARPFLMAKATPTIDGFEASKDLERELRKEFKRQKRLAMAQFKKAGLVNMAAVSEAFNPKVLALLEKEYYRIASKVVRELNQPENVKAAFDVVNPLTKARAQAQFIELSSATTATTQKTIDVALAQTREALIAEGVMEENTVPALTKAVQGVFEDAEKWRARRIAVTESARMTGDAEVLSAEGSSVVGWVPLVSSDACELCQVFDDENNATGTPRFGYTSQEDATNQINNAADVEAAYMNRTLPPFHVNCRCDKQAVFSWEADGMDLPPSQSKLPTAGEQKNPVDVPVKDLMKGTPKTNTKPKAAPKKQSKQQEFKKLTKTEQMKQDLEELRRSNAEARRDVAQAQQRVERLKSEKRLLDQMLIDSGQQAKLDEIAELKKRTATLKRKITRTNNQYDKAIKAIEDRED